MNTPDQKNAILQAMRVAFQHHQAGRLSKAEAIYRQVLMLDPDYFDALHFLGVVTCQAGNYEQGIELIGKAIQRSPSSPGPHNNLGEAYRSLNRLDEAEACYKKALALKPDMAEAHNNLGNVFKKRGSFDEAEACYKKALAFKPEYAEALNNLGNVLKENDRLMEAEACYRKALALKPDMAEAHNNLGNVFYKRGYLMEAEACYRKALALKPDMAEARWGLAMAKIPVVCGLNDNLKTWRNEFAKELAKLEAWFDKSHIEQGHECVGMYSPVYLAYQEEDNRDLLSKYGALCARLMEGWKVGQRFAPAKTGATETIRVGIVSAHIYDNSVWNAIVKGWFLHLDRQQFELHVFCLGSKQDGETAWAKSMSAYFEQGVKSLNKWVEVILAKQPDVLVYPEIGMDPMTVKLASLRLAPVQVAAWGHPETTGLPTMDYYLSAEDFEPPNAQENYSEQLVSLPHLGCYYQPLSVTATDPDFNGLDIEPEVPIFICPGTPFKYAPRYDTVFVEIAKKVGRCQFVFFVHHNLRDGTEKLRRRLEVVFARSGLDFNEYVVFIPWQSRPAFYGLMKRADVYLDTIGFSGFNTAMQAVECGLPIVTREGRFMRGRLASGILRRMGLSELIANSEEDYIALAVKFAQDTEYRRHIKQRIEATRSILFGDIMPVHALEKFFMTVTRHAES